MRCLPNNYVIIEKKAITSNYTSPEFDTDEGYRHLIEISLTGSGVNYTVKLEGSVSRLNWGDIPLKDADGVVQLINVDESAAPIFIEAPTKFPWLRIRLEDVSGTITGFKVALSKKV